MDTNTEIERLLQENRQLREMLRTREAIDICKIRGHSWAYISYGAIENVRKVCKRCGKEELD